MKVKKIYEEMKVEKTILVKWDYGQVTWTGSIQSKQFVVIEEL